MKNASFVAYAAGSLLVTFRKSTPFVRRAIKADNDWTSMTQLRARRVPGVFGIGTPALLPTLAGLRCHLTTQV